MSDVRKPYLQSDLQRLINDLAPLFGDRIHLSQAVREQHGQGEDSYGCLPPDMVIYPFCTEEVAQIVQLCNTYNIPIIPFGTGTSVEGHLLAVQGGVCIDLSEMNQIREVNPADMDCRVQAGVTREELNQALRYDGLFFPIDPGANASIGGMAATRASGTNAVRYGTMREAVMGLTVVTAQGEIIRTGGRARKSSAGYDLTRLYVGSEGTLGIITEVHLRLHPIPEHIRAAVCSFSSLESAVYTVIYAMQSAIPMARIELLNALQMKACIRYSKLEGYEEAPTLFLEFHGSEIGVQEQVAAFEEIAQEQGALKFSWAQSTESRNELWEARHKAYFAAQALVPGARALTTDVCVPISHLADAILAAEQEAEACGLPCPIVGHVGDGNFHLLIVFDPDVYTDQETARKLSAKVVERALAVGGTCTGEHGIGSGKKQYLRDEHGNGVAVMAQLKRALDPNNILNPGKVLDV